MSEAASSGTPPSSSAGEEAVLEQPSIKERLDGLFADYSDIVLDFAIEAVEGLVTDKPEAIIAVASNLVTAALAVEDAPALKAYRERRKVEAKKQSDEQYGMSWECAERELAFLKKATGKDLSEEAAAKIVERWFPQTEEEREPSVVDQITEAAMRGLKTGFGLAGEGGGCFGRNPYAVGDDYVQVQVPEPDGAGAIPMPPAGGWPAGTVGTAPARRCTSCEEMRRAQEQFVRSMGLPPNLAPRVRVAPTMQPVGVSLDGVRIDDIKPGEGRLIGVRPEQQIGNLSGLYSVASMYGVPSVNIAPGSAEVLSQLGVRPGMIVEPREHYQPTLSLDPPIDNSGAHSAYRGSAPTLETIEQMHRESNASPLNDEERFGPMLPDVERLRFAIIQANYPSEQTVQSILSAVIALKKAAIEVPAFNLLNEHRVADFVDVLLPASMHPYPNAKAYRDEVVHKLYVALGLADPLDLSLHRAALDRDTSAINS